MRQLRLFVLPLVTLLVGCSASLDKHTFTSDVYQPLNIEIVDNATERRLWYYEIPVHHKLTLEFTRPPEFKLFRVKPYPATEMTWKLVRIETNNKVLERGRLELSGMPIMMKMTLRPTPEYPPWIKPPAEDGDEVAAVTDAPDAATPGQTSAASAGDGAGADSAEADALVIAIAGDGVMTVGSRTVDREQVRMLMTALVRESPDRPVVIRTDETAEPRLALEVAQLCREVGVANVSVVTQSPQADEADADAEADTEADVDGQLPGAGAE